MKLILLFLGLTLFSCGDKDDAIKEVKELKDLLNLVILTQELGRPVGSTEDKLAKYPRIVRTIKEQEELKAKGSAYLSVRKTATFVKRPASLIISLRKEMKEQGLILATN